jgi:F-type H+-transporting ATPase subunit delta
MALQTLARRYAIAVYTLAAQANAVERIGADLERIQECIERDEATKQFFFAPVVGRDEKERTLAKVFEGRVDEIALHTLLLLVRKHRERLLHPMIAEYRALEMGANGFEPLVVTSARNLSKEQFSAVVTRIERIFGKRFEARLIVDPRLVGGMRITMGDRRVDGTIAGRLEELSRTLATS